MNDQDFSPPGENNSATFSNLKHELKKSAETEKELLELRERVEKTKNRAASNVELITKRIAHLAQQWSGVVKNQDEDLMEQLQAARGNARRLSSKSSPLNPQEKRELANRMTAMHSKTRKLDTIAQMTRMLQDQAAKDNVKLTQACEQMERDGEKLKYLVQATAPPTELEAGQPLPSFAVSTSSGMTDDSSMDNLVSSAQVANKMSASGTCSSSSCHELDSVSRSPVTVEN